MSAVQLIADTNVVSYMAAKSPLGAAYNDLIAHRHVGLTGHTIAELRAGAVIGQWGARRLNEYLGFLEQFSHVPCTRAMAEICGALRGTRRRTGNPIEWADAWAAACALWLDIPLVTHDRDLEGIPELRVLTVHNEWRVGEEARGECASSGIWTGESASRRFATHAIGFA
jgi:predicted nucleic acid-binding protein